MGEDFDGNGIGEPVSSHKKPVINEDLPIKTPRETDEFNNGKPGLQWQWYANPSILWSAQIPGTDYLRLFARSKKGEPNLWNVPNLLLQKLPAPNFTATTKVELTTEYYWENSWLNYDGTILLLFRYFFSRWKILDTAGDREGCSGWKQRRY